MITIKPIAPGVLPLLWESRDIPLEELAGYIASDGTQTLGTLFLRVGDPALILSLTAADAAVADGLLRAALYPLYESGARAYAFAGEISALLPPCYPREGRGSLQRLFLKNCGC